MRFTAEVQSDFFGQYPSLLVVAYPLQPRLKQSGTDRGNNRTLESMRPTPKIVAFQSSQTAARFGKNQRTGGLIP